MKSVSVPIVVQFLLTFLLALPGGRPVSAQTLRPGQELDLKTGMDRADLTGVIQPQGVALESTIDPEHYYIGPSDVFSVNMWISPPLSFSLTVTPEGTLIIPTVGEVRVSDMTLAEAKRLVLHRVKSRYRGSTEPTVTLVTPRQIVVTVTGNVLNPGSYVLGAYHRIDKAIEEANKLQVTQTQANLRPILANMSTRNITVRHKDGRLSQVDISKFQATKQDQWNPHLREGDLVVVPRKDLERGIFAVYGEVNVPGRFEYVAGDSVRDALQLAQGFTYEAMQDSIEFTRVDIRHDSLISTILDGGAILAGTARDYPLEAGDRIVVRPRPELRADFRVTVTGEVIFPGIYPVTKSRTRLSEIIRKAGGFTEFASLRTADVVRKSFRPGEAQLERLESLRGGATPEDSLYFIYETNLRIQKEIVNVDFESLFANGDSSQNIVLQDGDVIRVPSRRTTIYVFGQVISPGHVPFVAGETAEYYVRKAGGLTDRARESDMKIIKSKTRQWVSPGDTEVQEGDYVWVPKELEYPFSYYMGIIGQTASIISVAVSIVLLVIQTNK